MRCQVTAGEAGPGFSTVFQLGEKRETETKFESALRLLVIKLDPQGPRGCASDKARLRWQTGDDSGFCQVREKLPHPGRREKHDKDMRTWSVRLWDRHGSRRRELPMT